MCPTWWAWLQEFPSQWKMLLPNTRLPNKLHHPSQPSASRKNFTALDAVLANCQLRPTLLPHSVWLHGISQLKLHRVPISPDSAQDLQLFPPTQQKSTQACVPKKQTKGEAPKCTLSRAPCVSALCQQHEGFDRASTNQKHRPKDVLPIPWQYARPVAEETILKTFISVSNICWSDFYPTHCHAPHGTEPGHAGNLFCSLHWQWVASFRWLAGLVPQFYITLASTLLPGIGQALQG